MILPLQTPNFKTYPTPHFQHFLVESHSKQSESQATKQLVADVSHVAHLVGSHLKH